MTEVQVVKCLLMGSLLPFTSQTGITSGEGVMKINSLEDRVKEAAATADKILEEVLGENK